MLEGMLMPNKEINIGKKLRALRKQNGISLQQLSKDVGMSYSYLSGLENGKHSITIDNLQRLSNFFNTDIIFFFEGKEEKDTIFIGKNERDDVYTEDGVSYKIMTSRKCENLQMSYIKQPPRTPIKKNMHHHIEGDEIIYCVKGELHVDIGEDSYILNSGDCVIFKSNIDHALYTLDSDAEFLLINSPPYADSPYKPKS